MGTGERALGRGRLAIHTMFSLEPFTLKTLGSPQAFQTGETFNNAPADRLPAPARSLFHTERLVRATRWNVDAHSNGGRCRRARVRSATVHAPGILGGKPSGPAGAPSPRFGPHHAWRPVARLFALGHRIGGDPGSAAESLTSAGPTSTSELSTRGRFVESGRRGPWSAQLSGARVNEPEPLIPGDVTRLAASLSHTRSGPISTAIFVAWGHNRESHGTSNAWLFESTISWLEGNHLYARAELVGKELPHTHAGLFQPSHELMNVGAYTLGYTRDVFGLVLG